jgi:hypothetical protein
MKLAIADPPYPPLFRERFDLAGGESRVTVRSRARRWYGDGTRSSTDSPRADFHEDAGRWDDIDAHRQLLLHLVENFDGWAIATTPDGLGAYHPLPVNAQIMAWHKPNAMPGGGRLIERWEPVIVFVPEERRTRAGARVGNVLTAAAPSARGGRQSFVGSKPAAWTRWVLDALGYDPAVDELHDLFPGSGAVLAAADGMLSGATS